MPIRALENVRHSGVLYKTGDVIHGITESEKERLLKLKSAEAVETFEDVAAVVQEFEVDPVLFKELRDGLDDNYNAEELKRAARDAGVEFELTDIKEKVMEAIIKQGKVDLLLEDSE